MKRAGNLFNSIADIDNLRFAYWKAQRGRQYKSEVADFSKNVDCNLLQLREDLLQNNIAIGNYHYFKIYEPKERLICAASFRERVLHHAIMNICHPFFERFQIYHSYATRQGKGQYAALDQAKQYHSKFEWFCKLDIRKYFDSVNHEMLLQLLQNRFKDEDLLSLFAKIIDSYHTTKGYGLPIGNLTSQYFANFYLAHADHFIKETLKIPAYVRYMDDMVFWHTEKEMLIKARDKFINYVQQKLRLIVKPDCINRKEKGLPFLGYILFPSSIRLKKTSKLRFIRKVKQYNQIMKKDIWTQEEYANHIIPLIAFTRYAETKNLRKMIF